MHTQKLPSVAVVAGVTCNCATAPWSARENEADLSGQGACMQTLVEKRNQAIQAMIQEATKTGGHGSHQKSQLRPLHLIDFKDDNLQEIDLTEAAVLAKESSQHFQQGLATVKGNGSGAQS